ncbi:hypothetical protein T08_1401 [Trichinella sp. T8]|nr:hypothetical protein T08_1401 [Trichinella sp. T8]
MKAMDSTKQNSKSTRGITATRAYKMEKKAVLKKRSAEETKPILAIYDEEVSAASAVPSVSSHFPLFGE